MVKLQIEHKYYFLTYKRNYIGICITWSQKQKKKKKMGTRVLK